MIEYLSFIFLLTINAYLGLNFIGEGGVNEADLTPFYLNFTREGNESFYPFGMVNLSTIEAQQGSIVLLQCYINRNEEGKVSWIRVKNYQLLTVGSQIYSRNNRYQLLRREVENSSFDSWSLKIIKAVEEDTGLYECQVSSHPPSSLFLYLKINDAYAEILGDNEKFVRVGSSLQIVCVVHDQVSVPDYFFWYHGNRMINFDEDKTVQVEFESKNQSVLSISTARYQHSGNYTCCPSRGRSASTTVHILDDENLAAIYKVSSTSRSDSKWKVFFPVALHFVCIPWIFT